MVDACTIYRVTINMMIRNSNLPRQVCCFGNSNGTMSLQLVAQTFQNGELLIKFQAKQLQLRN